MTSSVLQCSVAAGAGNALRSSLNFGQAPLATWRNAPMCVTLNQASLPTRTCKWRSSHHMSTVAARPSHQRRDAKLGRDASRATYCSSYARSVGTLGVVGFSGRHAISQAAVTNSAGPRVNSNIRDLQSLRRNFSFGKGYLEREGKNGHDRLPVPGSDSPQGSPAGIRKVLPKSIGTVLTTHENIYTIPNLLTLSRVIATPFIGYAILHDAHTLALGLFVYAGVSDLLDGWIARRWKLQTVVGSIVDPMADKLLMTMLTVCLAAKGALPIWLAVIILGRDVGLAISAIYYRWISLPPPKTFTRYWDFSLPSAEVRPTTISKYNTFLQLALMGSTVVAPLVTGIEVGPALIGLQYIVATTTVWSGLSYVFSKDAVKILSDAKNRKQTSDSDDSASQ